MARTKKVSKAYEIIAKEFDTRCCTMVIGYILDKGMGNVEQITDEQIAELEGNPMMAKEFVQALVRTSRNICRECRMDDLIRLIHDEWVCN